MTVDQLSKVDLCYAPPYSPALDNIITAANVARNKLDGQVVGITPMEVKNRLDAKEDFIFLDVRSPAEVLPGLFLSGEIPRRTDFEDVGGAFYLDEAGTRPDPIADDQSLFFDTRDGVVVLLGCAHAGVVNTLRHVRRLTNDRPIHAVLGGMHLLNASTERMTRTVEALRELRIQRLGPAHCTGAKAAACLWHEFPQACLTCAVGSHFVF